MAESGAQFEFCKNSKKSPRKTWTERETTDLIEMLEVACGIFKRNVIILERHGKRGLKKFRGPSILVWPT